MKRVLNQLYERRGDPRTRGEISDSELTGRGLLRISRNSRQGQAVTAKPLLNTSVSYQAGGASLRLSDYPGLGRFPRR